MSNLINLTLILKNPSNIGFLDLSELINLTRVIISFPNSVNMPRFTGLDLLQTLKVEIGSQANSEVVVPADMLNGAVSLEELTFQSSNSFSTSIPDLSSFHKLRFLDLSKNNLSHASLAISDFSRLTVLETLILSGNPMLGTLPTSLSGATRLQEILVSNCGLSSENAFFDMSSTQVRIIDASQNALTSIPTSLCQLSATATGLELNLLGNPLVEIPSCLQSHNFSQIKLGPTSMEFFPLGWLHNSEMHQFQWLGNDRPMTLPGGVPFDFSAWTSTLDLLVLEGTQIGSEFPYQLKNASFLSSISLKGNRFTGSLPDDFFEFGSVETFDISGSSLRGPFPSSIGHQMKSINVSGNQFTTISDTIGQASSLAILDFSQNKLETIPNDSVWQQLRQLSTISLANNPGLTGNVPPSWLSGMVRVLDARGCSFTGDLPPINTPYLEYLHLGSNHLDGTISKPLRANLKEMNLDQNDLHGPLPSEFGYGTPDMVWTSLTALNLSHNQLSGALSANFSLISSLTSLDMSHNAFEGPLPNFESWSNLARFDGSSNTFNICQSDPRFGPTLLTTSTCNLSNNIFPEVCLCPIFVMDCQTETCPEGSLPSSPDLSNPSFASPSSVLPFPTSPTPKGQAPPTGNSSPAMGNFSSFILSLASLTLGLLLMG
jgi:Leucine-rich repeat (LRR) protein